MVRDFGVGYRCFKHCWRYVVFMATGNIVQALIHITLSSLAKNVLFTKLLNDHAYLFP